MPGGDSCFATSRLCNLRQVTMFLYFLMFHWHWHALTSWTVVRIDWASVRGKERNGSVRVSGGREGGHAHCSFCSTCTEYRRVIIAPSAGDGNPHVLREVKFLPRDATASGMMWLHRGSVDPWSGVSGLPHCSPVLASTSPQPWHRGAPAAAWGWGLGEMVNLKSRWHNCTAFGCERNSKSMF